MTRDRDRILPIALVRILRARHRLYSACRTLTGRLTHAIFSIEFGAGFATGTCRVTKPELLLFRSSTSSRPCSATHGQRLAGDRPAHDQG
jgi:hypothetical protein